MGNIGPLNGIKVVDLSRFGSGPVCTMIMADMGAEVIKVEEPGKGDPARWNPPLVGDIGGYFPLFNRNKKSITLNLRKDRGKEILHRFIRWGDVLVENYRPGFLQRLGFDYPAVREINPRIIMVSITAFGQSGPYAQRMGFDTIGQAMGGITSVTGTPGGPPRGAGAPVSDMSAGLFGTVGTLLALYHRQLTGLGQYVEATLMESVVYHMALHFVTAVRGRSKEEETKNDALRGLVGVFQAKDGPYIVIQAHDDRHWPIMAGLMSRQDLAETPGYRTRAERSEHAEELHSLLEAWVRANTIDQVEAILEEAGIPFGRVHTISDLLRDPYLKSRGTVIDVDHDGEMLPLFGPYPILSDTPGSIRIPCPKLGQHNEEVYRDLLGFSQDELAELKSEGVI